MPSGAWTPTRRAIGATRIPTPCSSTSGRIHLFWRGGDWNPAFSTSADGFTWAPAATLIRVPRQRPYVKVASDGQDTIHVAFTNGHPRETATSLFYARYTAGAWYRAGGRRLPDPPFTPADADRIYDGSRVHAWVHDVAFDAAGHPRVVYAVFHSATDHRYRHAHWTGSAWEDRQLTPAGGFFVEDGAEQQYSGGIAFDHAAPDTVYLSRPVDGQWEIERWRRPGLDAHRGHGRLAREERAPGRRARWRGAAVAARELRQLSRVPHGDRGLGRLQAGAHAGGGAVEDRAVVHELELLVGG